jgi:hypothetical protein
VVPKTCNSRREYTDCSNNPFLLSSEETGHYLSPVDPVPSYAQRGLPPSNLNDGYKVYQWIKPWDAGAGTITASKVAPAFEQPGGGIQYYTTRNVTELLKDRYIMEDPK